MFAICGEGIDRSVIILGRVVFVLVISNSEIKTVKFKQCFS